MRILLCLHASPKQSAAGVEVYSDALAHALSANHDVALLYPAERDESSRADHGAETIEHYVVSNASPAHSFADIDLNPRAHREIEEALEHFRPDIVHVQHLMGLSSNLPALAQARGIPVVMTLHDYWMQCAAGGQRFHRELGRCDEVSLDRCANCTQHMSGPALRLNAQLARAGIRMAAPPTHDTNTTGPVVAASTFAELAAAAAHRLAGRLTRVPTRVQRSRVQARWDRLLAMGNEVDRFVVPSEFMRDEMIRFGLPGFAISKVDLGVGHHHTKEARSLPETARHFGYLGGITRHKGIHTLIEAANQLPKDARVTIWGNEEDDGAYAKHLRALATHEGITFAGRLAQHEVPKHMREVDALVVPSLWHENAPLVIREAFAAGVPVVATRLGGHPELLASGGGLLYDPDAKGELLHCLARLMNKKGLARHLAMKLPRVRTIEEHAIEISAIYRDITSEIEFA